MSCGPDDPNGVPPEPDDSRLEWWIKRETPEDEDSYAEEIEGYKRQIDKYDIDPEYINSDEFKRIRRYCLDTGEYKAYAHILQNHMDTEDLRDDPVYHDIIYKALDIPLTHTISDDEWSEIACLINKR